MASYLGRNVNLALLVIIIGVIVALVGTTVFFQRSLQNRTEAYQETTGTLEECRTALANYESKYTQATQQVNQTTQDIRRYDQLYEQRTAELKETQTTLNSTKVQLQFEQVQRQYFQASFESQLRLAAQLNTTVNALNQQVTRLRSDLADACYECKQKNGGSPCPAC
jgi:uncharacterized membrane protein YgaE (UPF0421/DUF939 family)